MYYLNEGKKKMRRIKSKIAAVALSSAMAVTSLLAPVVSYAATTDPTRSDREIRNAALAREVAEQGMVLLENKNQALPITNRTVALFGQGAVRTVRGGTGSGDPFNGGLQGGGAYNVNQDERYNINVNKAFADAGYTVVTNDLLEEYAQGYDEAHSRRNNGTFRYQEMELTEEQVREAAEQTDVGIYVLTRIAGEGADRDMMSYQINQEYSDSIDYDTVTGGDYLLSDTEKDNIRLMSEHFDKSIVVLNVSGVMDTSYFATLPELDSLLVMGAAGQEAGNALLDIVNGKVTPSGKLVDTWARQYSDYPASETFAVTRDGDQNRVYEEYKEGIYVGYRYFDTFGITPEYEFGYGASYTDFDIAVDSVTADEENVTVVATVKNIGKKYSGKEVVQVYFSAPDSDAAEKPYQELAAFAKTDELAPGSKQTLTITFKTTDMNYYNEDEAAYMMDQGDYLIRVGNSSRNTHVVAKLNLSDDVITEQVSNVLPVKNEFEEWSKSGRTAYTYSSENSEIASAKRIALQASRIRHEDNVSSYNEGGDNYRVTTYTTDRSYEPTADYEDVEFVEQRDVTLVDVANGEATMEELVAQMSNEELATFNCGPGNGGVANSNAPIVGSQSSTVKGAAGETHPDEDYKIPNTVLADGPGGIRVTQSYEATEQSTGNRVMQYQYATAWPVGFVMAQTWDLDLIRKAGAAYGDELAELNINILLGPSLNIHRDPLCGRNFEYFSEDPFVSGKMAAAFTKGVQSKPGVGACLKHFAANNQETNRNSSDSRVSERAMREIYLEGFKIAIREAQPETIMTSYNKINGVPSGHNYDLCNNLARGEWGFKGYIMTDWNGGESVPAYSMHNGNDMIMPGGSEKVNDITNSKYYRNIAPEFDGIGQIRVTTGSTSVGITGSLANNEFTFDKDGEDTVVAELDDNATARVDGERIVVDVTSGSDVTVHPVLTRINTHVEEEHWTFWMWSGIRYHNIFDGWDEDSVLTTEEASVSNDGRRIIYKGTYEPNICRGDLQRSTMNILNIVMKSNDMFRLYGDELNDPVAKSYTSEFDNLVENMIVRKSAVENGRTVDSPSSNSNTNNNNTNNNSNDKNNNSNKNNSQSGSTGTSSSNSGSDTNTKTTTTTNKDGSKTTQIVSKSGSGTVTTTITRNLDGSKETVKVKENKDGSKSVTETKETVAGTKKTAEVSTAKDGSVTVTTSVENKKGVSMEASYTADGNKLTLASVETKGKTSVSIPTTVECDGKTFKVTKIAEGALSGDKEIKSVTIGKNITAIGEGAFKGDSNLKSITISGKVKTIGKGSFEGINKKAVIKIDASKKEFKRIVKAIKDSGIAKTVKFKRV